MQTISNTGASSITLPTGDIIPAKGSASVEKIDTKHPIVKSLFDENILVKGAPKSNTKPAAEKPASKKEIEAAVNAAVAVKDKELETVKTAVTNLLAELDSETMDEKKLSAAQSALEAAVGLS